MNRKNSLVLILVMFLFTVSVLFIIVKNVDFEKDNAKLITGRVTHLEYSSFSASENRMMLSENQLTVNDDAIYRTAYYSVNGNSWVSFNLEGNFYGAGNDWLNGTASFSLPPALSEAGEHYLIFYSCTLIENQWNCHGDKWQLEIITVEEEPVDLCEGVVCEDDNPCTVGSCIEGDCYYEEIPGCEDDSTYLRAYYVSNSGNDSNDGLTPETAWRTINKVNSQVLEPGDAVLFERGSYFREQFTLKYSGTEENKIIVAAYGTGDKPIIDAADIATGWSNEGANIWSINNPQTSLWPGVRALIVVVDDVLQYQVGSLSEVEEGKYFNDVNLTPNKIYIYSSTNPDTKTVTISNRQTGIKAHNQNYITISNIEVRHAGWAGVGISADDEENGYIHVHDVIARRNRVAGIIISGKLWHNIIEDCTVIENGNGVLVWGGQDTQYGCDNTTIRNCKSYNSIHNWVAGPAHDGTGFQLFASDNSIIENCESYNDFIPIFLDADYRALHNIARYNKMYNTLSSIDVATGIGTRHNVPGPTFEIYYNLIVNYGTINLAQSRESNAIEISRWQNPQNDFAKLLIVNNVVYDDDSRPSDGALYVKHTNNSIIKNNILVFPSSTNNYKNIFNYANTNLDSDHNYYHKIHASGWIGGIIGGSRYSNLADWQIFSGKDMNSIQGDPLFTNADNYDFTLQSSSPAKGAGVKIPDIPQVDIDGNPLPDNPSMGCYE